MIFIPVDVSGTGPAVQAFILVMKKLGLPFITRIGKDYLKRQNVIVMDVIASVRSCP